MRVRRKQAKAWEEKNSRPWLYAGRGMGAEVAGWKQAIEAEHAASLSEYTSYGQALLDLVKAFDKFPHVAGGQGSSCARVSVADTTALARGLQIATSDPYRGGGVVEYLGFARHNRWIRVCDDRDEDCDAAGGGEGP